MMQDNFADLIRDKLAKDPNLAQQVEFAASTLEVARRVYEARIAAKLTQKQLADKIGTSQSAIARVEDADYEGHSTRLLQRIASALGLALRIELYDPKMADTAEQLVETSRQTSQITWTETATAKDWQNLAITLPDGVRVIDKCVAA